jgi:hypothetical protein
MHVSARQGRKPPWQTTRRVRARHGCLEQGDQISAMWILSHCACDYQPTIKAQGFACEKSSAKLRALQKIEWSLCAAAQTINPVKKC